MLGQILEDWEDIVPTARDHPKPQLVEYLRGYGLLFREQFRTQRVLVLPAADELDDGGARREHPPNDSVNLLLDDVKDVLVRHRQDEQELAPVHVMNDVHALENRAGAHGSMAPTGREHEKIRHGGPLHRPGNRIIELAAQVRDGLALDVVHARAVPRVLWPQLLGYEKLEGFIFGVERQPPKIDDGVAAQHESNRLEV